MSTISKSEARLDILDVARLFAAFSVMYYHYLYRGWRVGGLSDVTFDFYDGFLKYGYLGVQLFFLISGFVISLSVKGKSANRFLVGRITRLYPAYWVGVLTTSLFVFFWDDGRFSLPLWQVAANLSMVSKLFGIPFVDGAYWTLIYEISFYFWVYISVKLWPKWTDVLFFVLLMFSFFSMMLDFSPFWKVVWGGDFIAYFVAGYSFYKIYSGERNLVYFVFVFICFCCSFLQAFHQVNAKLENPGVIIDTSIVFVLISLFYVFFLLISLRVFDRLVIPKAFLFGSLTYPCYLLHQNIGYIVFNKFHGVVSEWALLFIVSGLIVFLSYFVAVYIEPKVATFLRKQISKVFK